MKHFDLCDIKQLQSDLIKVYGTESGQRFFKWLIANTLEADIYESSEKLDEKKVINNMLMREGQNMLVRRLLDIMNKNIEEIKYEQ